MTDQIDFTLLWDNTAGYAVHCTNYDDAAMFFEQARALFPEMFKNWGQDEVNYYHNEIETIYTFDTRRHGKWIKLKFMYGSVDAARSLGYTIIEFSDIYTPSEIKESEMPLDMLFG